MGVRNRIQFRRGYSMGYSGAQIGDTLISGNTWTGGIQLAEGEVGYEIDTGRFKIGRRNNSGVLITWENLDYGGGGSDGGLIPNSGISILVNASGYDTISSILRNDTNDTNITISSANITEIEPSATGFYYKLGLADNLTNINNITISGNLSANNATFSNDVVVTGNLTVGGTGISFSGGNLIIDTLSVLDSGNFVNALTVGGVPVSLSGHQHGYSDITNFCSGVADCVNTQFIDSSGVQLIYSSGNNTLRIALSGESLAQHELNTTGLIVRTGTSAYATRSIIAGSNIVIDSGNGIAGNPKVSLSGTLTGLTAVTATTFHGDLNGNANTSNQVKTQTSSSSNEHYLTFVDSNNGSATAETIYTDGGIRYIPSTDTLIVSNISGVSISGSIEQANQIRTVSQNANNTYYLTFVDSNNEPAAYESLYTDVGIKYNPSTNLATFDGDISASGVTITNNLVVGGNLTVNGTTVTANVDSMIVEDPIIVLGKPSGTISAENKDRGVEFVYPSGSSTVAATGFFGFDKSATEFIAARDVTIAGEIVTVNNSSYLDARFNDIDGSIITATSQFSGPGSGLTGTASSLTVGKATNLDGGDAGRIPYQTAPGTTTFLSIGTSGQYLRVNNGATAPEWDTLSYSDISGTPTIGDGTLTLGVSGSGLTGSATFNANQTGNSTFTVNSNATDQNTPSTIVSRDASGNFIAGTITASLSGTATNALNIEVDTSSSNINHIVFVSGTDGNLKPNVNSNLRFDAANNILLGDDNTTPTTQIQYFIIDGGTP